MKIIMQKRRKNISSIQRHFVIVKVAIVKEVLTSFITNLLMGNKKSKEIKENKNFALESLKAANNML